MGLKRIYKHFKNDGIDGLIYRCINFFGIKTHYLNIREKNKYDLDQKIIKFSNIVGFCPVVTRIFIFQEEVIGVQMISHQNF